MILENEKSYGVWFHIIIIMIIFVMVVVVVVIIVIVVGVLQETWRLTTKESTHFNHKRAIFIKKRHNLHYEYCFYVSGPGTPRPPIW